MTAKIPCYIEFTDSGHFCRIVHQSGMIIAELLVNDGNFSNRARAAYDKYGMIKGIPDSFRDPQNPYRGDVEEIVDEDVITEEIDILQEMMEATKSYRVEEAMKDTPL